MTLIAGLYPRGCLTLIADVLITSATAPAQDIHLPSRVYVPLEWMRSLPLKPVALYRKVVELSPTAVLLWSGDFIAARDFAMLARECFQGNQATADALDDLRRACPNASPNFTAIIATVEGLSFVGQILKSRSTFAGEYMVAGSGRDTFREIMNDFSPNSSGEVRPDLDGLRVVQDLLAREIYTLAPLREHFGASYEIYYRSPSGFERVDDVLHMFTWIKAEKDSSTFSSAKYAHPIRQWYEGDQLCVASYSSVEASQQGLHLMFFAIPSILGQMVPLRRDPSTLMNEPKYMSIHHAYDIDGNWFTNTLKLTGSNIGMNFKFHSDGVTFRISPTDAYNDRIRARIARFRAERSESTSNAASDEQT